MSASGHLGVGPGATGYFAPQGLRISGLDNLSDLSLGLDL